MKKFTLDNYKIEMTDAAYKEAEKALSECQSKSTTHNFISVDEAVTDALKEMKAHGVPHILKGKHRLIVPETVMDYAKSCKYRMQCSRAYFVLNGNRIENATFIRGCTGEISLQTSNKEAALNFLAERIYGVKWENLKHMPCADRVVAFAEADNNIYYYL